MGSRLELRDATRVLLSRPLTSVSIEIGYAFPNAVVLLDAQTGAILRTEVEEQDNIAAIGLTLSRSAPSLDTQVGREPIVLQAPSAAVRDEVLLSVKGLLNSMN